MTTRLSVARGVAFAGLVLATLHQLELLFMTGPALVLSGLGGGDPKSIILTLLAVIDLALLVPVWRQRRWALLLAMAAMAILLRFGGPFMLTSLSHPAELLPWVWNLVVLSGVIAGLGFGVIACLEGFGRMEPAGLQSRQGAVLKAAGWAVAGMLVLGTGLSFAPADQGAMAQAPDQVVTMTLEHFRFGPDHLELPAGKRTAIFLINHDNFGHSFDVDELNLHVSVPAGGSAVAMVEPQTAGDLTFECNVPGHTAAGMTGTLHIK